MSGSPANRHGTPTRTERLCARGLPRKLEQLPDHLTAYNPPPDRHGCGPAHASSQPHRRNSSRGRGSSCQMPTYCRCTSTRKAGYADSCPPGRHAPRGGCRRRERDHSCGRATSASSSFPRAGQDRPPQRSHPPPACSPEIMPHLIIDTTAATSPRSTRKRNNSSARSTRRVPDRSPCRSSD